MASVLAIVSKAVFEKLVKAKGSGTPGDVLGIDRYTSKHASLSALEDGGSLFLVTVRPPDEALWLVGVLDEPQLGDDGWVAAPSTTPIVDVSSVKSRLRFATGAGLQAKPGALGMSLQTPRVLTDEDAALLRAAAGGKSRPARSTKTAKASTPAKSTKASKPAKPSKPAKSAGVPVAGLDAVRDAIEDGDGQAALEAALEAWRAVRAPALAELIDAISERVSGPAVETDHDWSMLATATDSIDLGRLLPAIPNLPVSFLPKAGELLAAYPDDPRLAMAVATWALDPPTTSSSTYPFWTKVLEVVARTRDPRVLPLLAKRLKKPHDRSKSPYTAKGSVSQFWPKFYAALARTAAKVKAAPAAAIDDKAVAKLVKAAGGLEVAAPARAPRQAVPRVDGPLLAQALAHAKAARVAPAIDAMVACWRELRSPEVADLIDRATRLLPAYDRTFPIEPKAAHAAWMAAFAGDPMAALPQLLHHVNVGGASAAERHLLELAALPDDPRIALRLAEVSGRFGISPERTQYWKSCWEILARIRDVRTVGPLRAQFNDFTGTYYNHHRQGRRILGDWVRSPGEPPAPDAATHKQLNQLRAALAELEAQRDRTEQDFLEAIAGDWADEAPRLVYADWLVEREHLRGEAIVLSCKERREGLSPAETKRLRLLEHGTRDSPSHIYGPLSDLELTIDRGIPTAVKCRYDHSTITWRHVAGEPLLAFVETIELEADDPRGAPTAEDLARVMLDPTAKRLSRVANVPNDGPGRLRDRVAALVKPRWKAGGHDLVRG